MFGSIIEVESDVFCVVWLEALIYFQTLASVRRVAKLDFVTGAGYDFH